MSKTLAARVAPADPVIGDLQVPVIVPKTAIPEAVKAPPRRSIARGQVLAPEATVQVLVDNPKARGTATFARWEAGMPKKGETATVAELLERGNTVADLRWGAERRFFEISGVRYA
jgi:hypothetical protein